METNKKSVVVSGTDGQFKTIVVEFQPIDNGEELLPHMAVAAASSKTFAHHRNRWVSDFKTTFRVGRKRVVKLGNPYNFSIRL